MLHSASVFKRRRISLTCFEDTSVIRHIAGVPRGLSNQPVQKMPEERMKHPEGLLPNLCGVLANRCKVTRAAVRRHRSIVIAISFIAILGGCDKKKAAEPDIRP